MNFRYLIQTEHNHLEKKQNLSQKQMITTNTLWNCVD